MRSHEKLSELIRFLLSALRLASPESNLRTLAGWYTMFPTSLYLIRIVRRIELNCGDGQCGLGNVFVICPKMV